MPPRIASTLLALLLVVAGVGNLLTIARRSAGMDFYQFWVGARVAGRADVPHFYDEATRIRIGEEYVARARNEEPSQKRIAVAQYRQHMESFGTPLLYAIFFPFHGTYERDLLLYSLLLLAALVVAIPLLGRISGLATPEWLLVLALLTLAFEPLRSDVRVANINCILLLLLALAAWSLRTKRFALAGTLLAFTTLAKPNFLLALPMLAAFWLVQRRWRDLRALVFGAAGGGALGLLVGAAYFRSASAWLEWARSLRALPAQIVTVEMGNLSLARLIFDATGLDASKLLMLSLFAMPIFIVARLPRDANADLPALYLATLVLLFASPLTWLHYLLLAVPLAIWLLRPGSARRQIAATVALWLMAIEPWGSWMPSAAATAAVTNGGLLLLFVTALVDVYSVNLEPATARRPAVG